MKRLALIALFVWWYRWARAEVKAEHRVDGHLPRAHVSMGGAGR